MGGCCKVSNGKKFGIFMVLYPWFRQKEVSHSDFHRRKCQNVNSVKMKAL